MVITRSEYKRFSRSSIIGVDRTAAPDGTRVFAPDAGTNPHANRVHVSSRGRRAKEKGVGRCLGTVALRVIIVWLFVNSVIAYSSPELVHTMINFAWRLLPDFGSDYDPFAQSVFLALLPLLSLTPVMNGVGARGRLWRVGGYVVLRSASSHWCSRPPASRVSSRPLPSATRTICDRHTDLPLG